MSEILTKIQSTADILGGAVFFANENGQDPEYPGVELVPNGMYIRLEGSDGSISIAAFFVEFRVSPWQAARVSCQEDKGWKIRISAAFWPPVRSSSAHGVERQLAEI